MFQSPRGVLSESCCKSFAKFTRKHQQWSLIFRKFTKNKTTLRVFSCEFAKIFKTTTIFASFWHFIFENHLIKSYFLCAHTVFLMQFSLCSYSVEMFSKQVQKVFHVQKLFTIRRSNPQEVFYIKSNKNLPKPAIFLKELYGRCLLENYPKIFIAVISLNTCEQLFLNF